MRNVKAAPDLLNIVGGAAMTATEENGFLRVNRVLSHDARLAPARYAVPVSEQAPRR